MAPPALTLRLAALEPLPMVKLPRLRAPPLVSVVLPLAVPLSWSPLASRRSRAPALTVTRPLKSLAALVRLIAPLAERLELPLMVRAPPWLMLAPVSVSVAAAVLPRLRAPPLVRLRAALDVMVSVLRPLASRRLMLVPLALTAPPKSLAALLRVIAPATVRRVAPLMLRAPLWLREPLPRVRVRSPPLLTPPLALPRFRLPVRTSKLVAPLALRLLRVVPLLCPASVA